MGEAVASRRLFKPVMVALAALLILIAAGTVGNTVARYQGWTVDPKNPEELSALLSPHYRLLTPAGPGPFPTGSIFSGCDGVRDNIDRWATVLNEKGWAALIVDSHTPRGLSAHDLWRLVCAGQILTGAERAGDALVALRDARRMEEVEPSRIVLIGTSHGGWAIMELLVLEEAGQLPPNLTAIPEGLRTEAPLKNLAGQILLYPYCGIANRARQSGWRHSVPTLMLLSGADTITPSKGCLKIAALQEARGLPMETVVFEGINHGFDQQDRAAFSPLVFDPEATAEALRLGAAFLDGLPE